MEFINTGVRITRAQATKLEELAQSLCISRNQVFGELIDAASVESQPKVKVPLKANRHNATGQGERVAAIEAV